MAPNPFAKSRRVFFFGVLHTVFHRVDHETIMLGGGAPVAGLWLIVDGAKRALGDAELRQGVHKTFDAVFELCGATAELVVRSPERHSAALA